MQKNRRRSRKRKMKRIRRRMRRRRRRRRRRRKMRRRRMVVRGVGAILFATKTDFFQPTGTFRNCRWDFSQPATAHF